MKRPVWMMLRTYFVGLTALALVFGPVSCAQTPRIKEARKPVVPQNLYSKTEHMEGSIWPGSGSPDNMLFRDSKARRVGDIITIVVNENANSSQNATIDTSKSTTIDLQTGRLLGLPGNLGIQNFLGSGNSFNPNLDAQVSKTNQGAGTTTREGTLTATISAVVTSVLPGGTMEIRGRRSVTVNNEEQIMVLTGLVRSQDIGFSNTVDSSKIAEAKIVYVGKGIVADEARVGWGARLLGWVWPF